MPISTAATGRSRPHCSNSKRMKTTCCSMAPAGGFQPRRRTGRPSAVLRPARACPRAVPPARAGARGQRWTRCLPRPFRTNWCICNAVRCTGWKPRHRFANCGSPPASRADALSMRVVDISGGGLAVAVPTDCAVFSLQKRYPAVLSLPDGPDLEIGLVVCNLLPQRQPNGIEIKRVGMRFDTPRRRQRHPALHLPHRPPAQGTPQRRALRPVRRSAGRRPATRMMRRRPAAGTTGFGGSTPCACRPPRSRSTPCVDASPGT